MDHTYCSNFVRDGLENKVTRAPGFDLDVRQPAHRPRLAWTAGIEDEPVRTVVMYPTYAVARS